MKNRDKIKKYLAILLLVIIAFSFGILSTILINFLGFNAMATILTTMSLIILSLGLMVGILLAIQWAIEVLWTFKNKKPPTKEKQWWEDY